MGIENFIERQRRRLQKENRIGTVSRVLIDAWDNDFRVVEVVRTPKADPKNSLPTDLTFQVTARQAEERRLIDDQEVKWNLLGKIERTALKRKVFRG